VRALLARLGLDAEALQCGAHPPMHEPSARALGTPTVLHNNCSGKHSFMLAASAAMGWPGDYRPVDHPLQARNRARLDAWGEVKHGVAIDGCSVPTFHAPLSAQARAWSRLAAEMAAGTAAGRVGLAMSRQPFYMSGAGRLDLAVVEGAPEPLAVKVGAEGLFCIARPAAGTGIAVKVHSGNNDALAVAVRAVLAELGVVLAGPWPWAEVRNVRRVVVGERVATWD
jgi:L-asparaginase II